MKLKMFSMYDMKAEAFITPFFLHNENMAKRAIYDASSMDTHMFSKHPEDYALYHLGEFDDSNGMVESLLPRNLGLVSQIAGVYAASQPIDATLNQKGPHEISDEPQIQRGAEG